MFRGLFPTLCAVAGVVAPMAHAQASRISEDRGSFQFSLNGQTVTIDREGPACPPACVQPMLAAPGIGTIGELELIDFMDIFVSAGKGLMIDARLPEGYAAGTVPGAVNVPAATLAPGNPYRDDLLRALGVVNGDFSGAYDLVIFGSGAEDAQPPVALRSLLDSGYPSSKLKYYRGGLRGWMSLGLTVARP